MLFTVSTSRLLTLLYLCVSILTASGSPLPPDGVTRFGPELPPGFFRPEVRLKLGVVKPKQSPIGHAVLAIDDVMVHATWADLTDTQLIPKKVPEEDLELYRRASKWFPLGKAKFKSQADKEQALTDMLSIKLPPYGKTGGGCWDYIESALETLRKRGELLDSASVLKEFTERKGHFK
ncbi:hypothetical protein F5050DRAFT_134646 [Lentinula boryana]|uniref:Uncharacterized protein n=1 Tax=Lentinula boryana TaxID=40481 RepID=A0ABQ8QCT7_9AGAR|nr:hypothetical protein F5050DRAFT_134646 [Lentinula boryana]